MKPSFVIAAMKTGLFDDLDDALVEQVLRSGETLQLDAGHVVVSEGDAADTFFLVLRGQVEVYRTDAGGAEQHLSHIDAGGHFGEQSLLEGWDRRRSATVRAVSPVDLLRLSRQALEAMLSADHDLRQRLQSLGRSYLENRMARSTALVQALLDEVPEPRVRELEGQELVYRQGSPTGDFFVILGGYLLVIDEEGEQPTIKARLGVGATVGDRDGAARAYTVRSEDDARILVFSQAQLQKVREQSEEARHQLASTQRVWDLPQRGLVTQYLGDVDGEAAITQVYDLLGGERLMLTQIVGSERLRLQRARGEATARLHTPDHTVEVGVDEEGRILSLSAVARDKLLPQLIALAVEGEPLSRAQQLAIAEAGTLEEAPKGTLCACMRVLYADVERAIQSGAATVAQLQQRTGAGMACGTCLPALHEAAGAERFLRATIRRVEAPTPDVRRLTLAAEDGGCLPAAIPGQHTVLRATIGGDVVARAYTIASAAGAEWEVLVKLVPGGAFSPWLFQWAEAGRRIDVSQPRGAFVWRGGPAPVICFVAGIGVTPALAMARTLLGEGWPHRMIVDLSIRNDADQALLGDVDPGDASNLDVLIRVTSRQGRLKQADATRWHARFPAAAYYLCGPEGFMAQVSDWLSAAGVPPAQIHQESFQPGSSL